MKYCFRTKNFAYCLCLWKLYGDFLLLNRVDGILLNVTDNSSQPIEINNGSVLLDRQVRFTSEEEENSVVLISLEYESGKYSRLSFPIFQTYIYG